MMAPLPAQVRVVIGPGKLDGNTYRNPSLGIRFQLPEEWLGIAAGAAPGMGAEAPPEFTLLTARPEGVAATEPRLITLAAHRLPPLAEREPGRFLMSRAPSLQGPYADGKVENLAPASPLELDQRRFARLDQVVTPREGPLPPVHTTRVAGFVNGVMLELSFAGGSRAEVEAMLESLDSLRLFPPDLPEDVEPEPPLVIPAPPESSSIRRIVVPESVARAQVRSRVEPEYPEEARARGVHGEVLLRVIVGTTGVVEEVSVLSGHPLLNDAALDAVRQWVFEPYLQNGRAVEVETTIRVRFLLGSARSKS